MPAASSGSSAGPSASAYDARMSTTISAAPISRPGSSPPPSVARHQARRSPGPLRLLVHADPTFMAMENLKRQFEQYFGVPIRVRAHSIDRLREEGLANSQAAPDRATTWSPAICPGSASSRSRACCAARRDDRGAELNVADFHPAGWKGAHYRGTAVRIPDPYHSGALVLPQGHLSPSAGSRRPRRPTKSWRQRKILHQPHKTGMRGIAWNAARGTPMGHTFIFVLAAFGRAILNLRTGRPRLRCRDDRRRAIPADDRQHRGPAARRNICSELLQYSPPNILSMAWYERILAYSRGEVAMAYGYNHPGILFRARRHLSGQGPYRNAAASCRRGGRATSPLSAATFSGIPANLAEERVEAAWQAVQFLTSSEAIKLYIINGSRTSPRFSVSADPEVARTVAGDHRRRRDGAARAGAVLAAPAGAGDRRDHQICGEEMHDMARGLKPVKAALADAQNRADRLMRSQGLLLRRGRRQLSVHVRSPQSVQAPPLSCESVAASMNPHAPARRPRRSADRPGSAVGPAKSPRHDRLGEVDIEIGEGEAVTLGEAGAKRTLVSRLGRCRHSRVHRPRPGAAIGFS